MSGGLEPFPAIEHVLIVRLGAMGDVIHTLPAVAALRETFPNAMIGWLIEERWAELLCAAGAPRRGLRSTQRPLVDWVHTVDLHGWRRSLLTLATVLRIARVRNDVRSAHYDVAIDLQGAIRSAVLARCSGASAIWGSAQTWESPASLWYTRRVIARGAHVVDQNLSIVAALTQTRFAQPRVDLPHDPAAEHRINEILAAAGMLDFALLNPGAGWGAKRWPAERYGSVARVLGRGGVRSIVNYGPGEEKMASETEAASAGAAMPLRASITELIALTRRAKLFIGGDTGPLHLAAALQVPVVAIFGPTDPARNGPYRTPTIVLRNPASRTSHARRAQPDEGLLDITAESVVDAAHSLLAYPAGETPHG